LITSIGARVPRREDAALLTGRGRFIDDIDRAHQAHAWIVRSPFAHARIGFIDTADAAAMPGVVAVLTHRELAADGIAPLGDPNGVIGRNGAKTVHIDHPLLAGARAMHVGDPVAMVVARTRREAQEAAERVIVDYEELDVAVDGHAALEPDAPPLWPSAPGNLALDWEGGDARATDAAFARAAHVTRLVIVNNRVIVAPMETRGAIAEYESRDGRYTIRTPSQGVGSLIAPMARSLGVAESRVRVITDDVGGAFGIKIPPYPEQVLVAWAARRGFKVDINVMRHEEGKLFGNAGPEKGSPCKSRVLLRLEDWSDGKLSNDKWREEVQSVASWQSPANPSSAGRAFYPLHYVGYGLLKNARQMEETRSPAIGCGESKILRIAAPRSDIDYIRDAMRLVHLYGALGGRSRNGWGSVDLMDNSEANTPDLTLMKPWKEAMNLDWPHAIGKDEDGPLIWETEGSQDWRKIMEEFGKLRKSIRKFIKAPRGSTRLPNTIRFKVRKSDRNGHIKGVIFHMPCKPPANINDQNQVSDWEKAHCELENSLSRSKE